MDCSSLGSSVMGFPRQEYYSGLPFPSLGDFPNPGIKPRSPSLQADSLPSEPPGKPSELLLAVYFICILDYGNCKFEQFSYSSSKQRRQFVTSTVHLALGLLTDLQRSGVSSFAKNRDLKTRRVVVGHQKLTMTYWEDYGSWSSYNYMRSCQRTQLQPFYSHLAFEANW